MAASLHTSRAGWAARHALMAIAALTVLAVGLHWWRTRGMAGNLAIPPSIQIHAGRELALPLVFSPEDNELFVGAGQVVEIYDPATGNKKRSWSSGIESITHLSLSADGLVAMTAGYQIGNGTLNSIVKTWNLVSDRGGPAELSRITKGATHPSASALSPDGTQLALAWRPMGAAVGFNIHVFDVSSGTEKFACTGNTNLVGGLSFSPASKTLVSVAWDNTIRKWDMASGQQLVSWPVNSLFIAMTDARPGGDRLSYSADGKSFVVGGAGKGLEIRDAATGSVRARAAVQTDSLLAVAFSPDGTLVAAGGDTYSDSMSFLGFYFGFDFECTAGIWDAATGKLIVTLQQNGPGFKSLAFSHDGKWIAVSNENGMISIWDVAEALARD